MKKTLSKFALLSVLALGIIGGINADDGETGHSTRSCTPTAEQPCPEVSPSPLGRQANPGNTSSDDSHLGFFEWLAKTLGY